MILKDQKVFLGERQFTTDTSALAIEAGVEPQDDTRLGNNTRIYEAGLLTVGWNLQGFWNAADGDDVDDVLFGKLGVNGVPVSILAEGTGVGDRAFFLEALESTYQFMGEVGNSHKFSVGGQARGQLLSGVTLRHGQVSASGDGTAVEVGAVATGQSAYAALHVYAESGTTLDVILQSDTTGFPSPVTRITFAQASGITSEFKSVAGPITDTFWRASHTVVGGNFSYLLVMGIY